MSQESEHGQNVAGLRKGNLPLSSVSAKKKHKVPEKIIIEPECIRSRAKRGKFSGSISGNTSPMLDIEPYLVEMIGALEKMRVPISSRQGLSLANSIISGTSYEKNVMAWKEKHCFGEKTVLLGKGYWAGFIFGYVLMLNGMK